MCVLLVEGLGGRRLPLLEVAMQSAFQEKCSYTMAVRGLLGEGSVKVRRMRAFTVANEMGRGGVSVAASAAFSQFVSGLVAWYALVTWNPDKGVEAFPVVLSLANRLGVVWAALNSLK